MTNSTTDWFTKDQDALAASKEGHRLWCIANNCTARQQHSAPAEPTLSASVTAVQLPPRPGSGGLELADTVGTHTWIDL